MMIYCEKPVWTYNDTKEVENKFIRWLGMKKDSNENRRQFAKQSLGRIYDNASLIDVKNYFQGVTHTICRASESIALKLGKHWIEIL